LNEAYIKVKVLMCNNIIMFVSLSYSRISHPSQSIILMLYYTNNNNHRHAAPKRLGKKWPLQL